MDEKQVPSGSFMAPAGGGGNPLKDLLEQRGLMQGGGGVLNQVGPASPTFANAAQPSQPGVPSAASPLPQASEPGVPAGGGAPAQMNPENQIILRALDQRLKSLSAIEKAQAGVR